jgi:hypothetical protein
MQRACAAAATISMLLQSQRAVRTHHVAGTLSRLFWLGHMLCGPPAGKEARASSLGPATQQAAAAVERISNAAEAQNQRTARSTDHTRRTGWMDTPAEKFCLCSSTLQQPPPHVSRESACKPCRSSPCCTPACHKPDLSCTLHTSLQASKHTTVHSGTRAEGKRLQINLIHSSTAAAQGFDVQAGHQAEGLEFEFTLQRAIRTAL